MKIKRILMIILAILPLAMVLAVYNKLPGLVPMHWGIDGSVDRYVAGPHHLGSGTHDSDGRRCSIHFCDFPGRWLHQCNPRHYRAADSDSASGDRSGTQKITPDSLCRFLVAEQTEMSYNITV